MATDYYSVLEIEPTADQLTISAAYKRLVVEYHPDRNPAPDATSRTAELNRAYRILSDPGTRAQYDRTRVRDDIPRAILGMSKLTLYELQDVKPKHGQVRWEPGGIWQTVIPQFSECRSRRCLVLLKIEPRTNRQIYQHGDPGPVMMIDPNQGEFSLLRTWLDRCHLQEADTAGRRR